jgi:hypothetical protein
LRRFPLRYSRLAPRASHAALLLAAFVLAACGSDTPTTPTPPTPTTTDVFIGALGVGETKVHSFSVAASGTAQLTLASLTINGQLTSIPVTLVIGTPTDGTCTASTSTSARPALSANLAFAVSAGAYCVSVADTNSSLGSAATYSLRVVHP